jgi:hypothetical protein
VVGAAFSIALSIIPAIQGKSVPPWLWALALALAVLPASFLAWRNERRKVEKLEQAAEERRGETGRPRARSITDRSAMIGRLLALPKGSIKVACVVGDPEPCRLARELKDLLTAGGWEVEGPSSIIIGGGSEATGVLISVKNPQEAPPRATALKVVLEEARIAVTLGVPDPRRHHPVYDDDRVELLVGDRPDD